jgi:hypothetical protein
MLVPDGQYMPAGQEILLKVAEAVASVSVVAFA